MFYALPIDPDRSDQDEILADVNAVEGLHRVASKAPLLTLL
jgi:hypothetical protein